MTLAAGNFVYLEVNNGLMTDPPLFGVVDFVNGSDEDVVRVCWENGAQTTFSTTNQSLNKLVIIGNDSSQGQVIGNNIMVPGVGPTRIPGIVCRSFFKEPSTINERSALVLIVRDDPRYNGGYQHSFWTIISI